MLIKLITPLPRYKLLDYSYGFEIDGETFYIRAPATEFPDITQLFYADKESLVVYPICTIFGSVISFPTFEFVKEVKSTINYDSTNSVLFTIPDKIKDLTGLPSQITLRYAANILEETFNEFFKIIAAHFSLFKDYEKDIQKQILTLLPVYSDYRLNHVFTDRINKFNINDYITAVEENIQNTEYTISYYTDDSVYSVEIRNHCQKCLTSLKHILNHLRKHPCALNV